MNYKRFVWKKKQSAFQKKLFKANAFGHPKHYSFGKEAKNLVAENDKFLDLETEI